MSQPRRKRRRRRRGAPGADSPAQAGRVPRESERMPEAVRGRRRRRRKGGRRASAGPTSLEEVVQAIRGQVPDELTAPADGQTLEGIIGDLQSRWGVPQYPQEYRITLKVVEESKGPPAPPPPPAENGGVAREKAPAAPRVSAPAGEGPIKREKAPRRKRRSRRGRRRK